MQIIDKLFPDRVFKFKGPDKSFPRLSDELHNADYRSAEVKGRVRLGKECMYYNDLGVKYYCPYEHIERAFGSYSMCQPDDSPPYYYYRLNLFHGGKQFANLIFDEEEDVKYLLVRIKEINPKTELGAFAPDTAGKGKKK
ncbi:MAG: hypothetical protein Q4F31_07120 [Eubacteriales bacterium]|nr:hypothetical protein [Eubacteriales bacterium]